MERLDTAHERWDQWWGDARHRALWSDADPAVVETIGGLLSRGATRVVDVGAGIGRHSRAFAAAGLSVVAIDASRTGLYELARRAAGDGLTAIETQHAPFTTLPLDDGSADHVLAWNVLYHGDREIVRAAYAECRRILRPGGTFHVTMLSKRHRAYRIGVEVRPDTFVDERSEGDKDHPHFYVDAHGLTGLLAEAGFDLLSLEDVDQSPPGGFHWVALAQATVDA